MRVNISMVTHICLWSRKCVHGKGNVSVAKKMCPWSRKWGKAYVSMAKQMCYGQANVSVVKQTGLF